MIEFRLLTLLCKTRHRADIFTHFVPIDGQQIQEWKKANVAINAI